MPGSEKDRIVATGIFGLPWDVRFSTNITLGTGAAFNVLDFSQGFDLPARERTHPFQRTIRPEKTWGFADRSVDFRLEKDFGVFARRLGRRRRRNLQRLQLGELRLPGQLHRTRKETRTSATPSCVVNLGRREQVGLKINF